MRRSIAATLVLTFALGSLTGCDSTGQSAGLGALLGGLAGAATAVVTGNDKNIIGYAAAGAAAGAVAGYFIGRAQERKTADRNQAIQASNYSGSGYLLAVQNKGAYPNTVSPGGETRISYELVAVGPNAGETFSVQKHFRLLQQGSVLKEQDDAATVVDNGGGVFLGELPLPIPQGTPTGSYTVEISLVSSVGAATTVTVPFYVG